MKSTKNRRAVIVGVVISLGLLIFMVGVLTLGGQNKTFVQAITLKAVFHDINGLQPGNNIWFAGVKVGTIKRISFNDQADVQVDMKVEERVQKYIRKDAYAKVSSDGLIGNKIIVIYGGTPGAPAVADEDMLRVEKLSTNEEILDTLQQNNKNLVAITANFKLISQEIADGKGTVGKLISDPSLGNSLQATLTTLEQASRNARALTDNLSDFSARMQRKGTFANELVTDTVVFKRLRTSVAQIQQAADNAHLITDNLNNATRGLNDSTGSALGVLLNNQQAAADLQITLRNLNAGTAKLDQDLEAAQHNFLLRGFFKKKAKREAAAQK